jgi:hypothetical protein
MSRAADEREAITDPATQLALARLAESRGRLGEWTSEMAARMAARHGDLGALGLGALGFGGFKPRSETLKMLMSLVLPRLPWLRWGLSAALPLVLRWWRRR